MIIQEFQQVLAFFLLEADDVACELRVDINGLLACDWVCANDWMDAADGVAADDTTLGKGAFSLLVA